MRFHPVRKWRLDYSVKPANCPQVKVGVELHGAVHSGGRHTRGIGFTNDCEKMNAAQELGWVVLAYTTKQVKENPEMVIGQVVRVTEGRVGCPM